MPPRRIPRKGETPLKAPPKEVYREPSPPPYPDEEEEAERAYECEVLAQMRSYHELIPRLQDDWIDAREHLIDAMDWHESKVDEIRAEEEREEEERIQRLEREEEERRKQVELLRIREYELARMKSINNTPETPPLTAFALRKMNRRRIEDEESEEEEEERMLERKRKWTKLQQENQLVDQQMQEEREESSSSMDGDQTEFDEATEFEDEISSSEEDEKKEGESDEDTEDDDISSIKKREKQLALAQKREIERKERGEDSDSSSSVSSTTTSSSEGEEGDGDEQGDEEKKEEEEVEINIMTDDIASDSVKKEEDKGNGGVSMTENLTTGEIGTTTTTLATTTTATSTTTLTTVVTTGRKRPPPGSVPYKRLRDLIVPQRKSASSIAAKHWSEDIQRVVHGISTMTEATKSLVMRDPNLAEGWTVTIFSLAGYKRQLRNYFFPQVKTTLAS